MNGDVLFSLSMAVLPVIFLLAVQKIVVEKGAIKVDYFSPLYVVIGALLLGSVVRVYWIYSDPDVAYKIFTLFGPYRFSEVIDGGLLLILVGTMFFGVGFAVQCLSFNKKESIGPVLSREEVIDDRKYQIAMMLLGGVGFLLVSLYLSQIDFLANLSNKGFSAKRFEKVGDVATSYSYLKFGGDIFVSMALFQSIYYYGCGRSKVRMIVLIFLVAMAVVVPFVSSSRGEIVYLLLMLFAVRSLLYKTVTRRQILILISVSFVLIAVLGGIRKLKTDYDFKVADLSSEVVDAIVYSPHFVGVGKSSVIVEAVPEQMEYMYGGSYLALVLAPIPRTIWTDKPVVRVGRLVGVELFKRDSDSGVPPGGIAEAYLNFGWAGVVFVMGLVGAIVARFHRAFQMKRLSKNIGVIDVGVYVVGLVIVLDFFTTDFVGNMMRLIKYVLPFFVLYFYSVRTTYR